MRIALAAVAIVLATSCSRRGEENVARTSTTTAPLERHDVVAPVFDQPANLVQLAAVRAARGYFNGQVVEEEPEARLIHVVDREAWAGDALVDIAVVELGDGATRVDVSAAGFGRNQPLTDSNTRRRVVNYLARLDREVQALVEMRRLLPDQTPAAAGSGTVSATSRP